jgi:hypothetical protein
VIDARYLNPEATQAAPSSFVEAPASSYVAETLSAPVNSERGPSIISEEYSAPQARVIKDGERIFGEDELLGGKGSHSYETCANPPDWAVHKEEFVKRNPPTSLTDKIKQGFLSLKEKLLGAEEVEEEEKVLSPRKMESEQYEEEIPDERNVEKQNKPRGRGAFVASRPDNVLARPSEEYRELPRERDASPLFYEAQPTSYYTGDYRAVYIQES